ncbi:hypothetical protein [Saccharothrix yanglingensis]|uniref:hypothetical protein n=1 Tax=Saccharothrix yanglingensis TaxID=659496 RepID=UPI0027D34102|nr:hypothetical protein [Saccharothrix yanglingensis]
MADGTPRVLDDTPLRAWVDHGTATVHLAVGPPPDEVLVDLSLVGASRLADALQREVAVLEPTGCDCDECLDTGTLWTPMARGAASTASCHCPAARR